MIMTQLRSGVQSGRTDPPPEPHNLTAADIREGLSPGRLEELVRIIIDQGDQIEWLRDRVTYLEAGLWHALDAVGLTLHGIPDLDRTSLRMQRQLDGTDPS